ncbi:MAG: DCC1-like thiol-disulfide oxidoreductase family protein [Planctomycetales bacterium]
MHLAGMAVVALFTVGFYTRITSVLAFVVVVSYFQRILLITTELDAILTALMFYLCLAPSGAALSVDAFIADRKRWKATLSNKAKQALPPLVQPSVSTMIATRLLQVHLTAICLMMAIGKLMEGVWWNGDAAWLLIAKTQNNLFDLTWMHAYGPVLDAWTHFIVWTQCVFPFLVWNKTARPLMLAVASLMWLSLIPLTGMVEFSLLMIAANLAFVSPVALRKFVDLLTGEARMTVVYDGLCPLCRNSASAIKALDVCDAIKLADFNREDPKELHPELTLDKCMRSMFVIEGERLSEGYDGFTRIARGLPTLWPAAWLTFLPGVASLGRPLYRRVADARARNASCDEGTCHVGSGPAARSNEKQEREISV